MRRLATLTATVFVLVASAGCGTMANLEGREPFPALGAYSRPPYPFGGVGNDLSLLARVGGGAPEFVVVGLFLMDLPVSFVADVVTLPWTTFEFTREWLHSSDRYESDPFFRIATTNVGEAVRGQFEADPTGSENQ